jgi:hypothetical protein
MFDVDTSSTFVDKSVDGVDKLVDGVDIESWVLVDSL